MNQWVGGCRKRLTSCIGDLDALREPCDVSQGLQQQLPGTHLLPYAIIVCGMAQPASYSSRLNVADTVSESLRSSVTAGMSGGREGQVSK